MSWEKNSLFKEDEMLKAVQDFCYPGDVLSAGGGCEPAVVTHLQIFMGKVLSTATTYHRPHFPGFDLRLNRVFKVCEKCDATLA